MRTLLVDNHDSYTFNLYQLLAQVTGRAPVVLANDDPAWEGLDLAGFDLAVISPGPGHPGTPRDVGHSPDLLAAGLPVLGVCLGHQLIALHAGAVVEPAPRPRHGHLTRVRHSGDGPFAGLPQDFTAVRYHSLAVAEPLPAELEPIAWAEDGVLMALRHRAAPRWGVQFHPESVATRYGRELIANVVGLAARAAPGRPAAPPAAPRAPVLRRSRPRLTAHVRRIDVELDTERVHLWMHAGRPAAFWLDSALVRPDTSRFSFLGAPEGPAGEVLTYRLAEPDRDETVLVEPVAGPPRREPGTIFDVLAGRLAADVDGTADLPFDLTGGYVGCFGYELKALGGATARHRAATPDAVWIRADRFVAVDHVERCSWLVAVAAPDDGQDARRWLERTAAEISRLPAAQDAGCRPGTGQAPAPMSGRGRERYLADIAECGRQLRAGESYEICLTDTARGPAPADDLAFYRRLRRLNPAPYGALLRAGELAVFSSSPERFLRIGADRVVESRPVKGTAPRDPDPVRDAALARGLSRHPKTRAENLMIVDLLRNDLGRVCEIGSIEVPSFLTVESYATVHQLVSTVRGRLAAGVDALDCVRSCFPGGSMTGAPKERTMEIIDRLEDRARGIYSGALGYLAFGGAADLSIVIRAAVRWRDELSVGAGGAIVLDSDPAAEYEELLLKAAAVTRALAAADAR